MAKTNKTVEQRESILEDVESAMLRGAYRQIDIMRAVPAIRRHDSAKKYMETVSNRWCGRNANSERERARLINEEREALRVAWEDWQVATLDNRIKLYAIMIKGRDRLAKLHGLDVRKVDVSGNIDMLEQREERIALLTASAEAHSVRSILQRIGPNNRVSHQSVHPQRIPAALPPNEEPSSE